MNYDLDHQEIRDGITKLCQDFGGAYWQDCDQQDAYPAAFVDRLTSEGYLAALIPEAYGGLGLPLSAGGAILEEIHRSGGNAARPRNKAGCRKSRLARCGCRRLA